MQKRLKSNVLTLNINFIGKYVNIKNNLPSDQEKIKKGGSMESIQKRFEQELMENTHIYVDIRDRIGFAFYFEGLVKDFFEKENKYYFNQDYLDMDFGFYSIRWPWNMVTCQNHIYTLIHGDFRASIMFVNEM